MNRNKESKIINYLREELIRPENDNPRRQTIILETVFSHLLLQRHKIEEDKDFDAKDAIGFHYEELTALTNNQNDFIDLSFDIRDAREKIKQKEKKEKERRSKKSFRERMSSKTEKEKNFDLEIEKANKRLKSLLDKTAEQLGFDPNALEVNLRNKTAEDLKVHCLDAKKEDEGKMLLVAYKNQARWKLNDLDIVFGGQFQLSYEFIERIEGLNSPEQVIQTFTEGIWKCVYDTLLLIEIDVYEQVKERQTLYKYLKLLPRGIRESLYFVEKNVEKITIWDKDKDDKTKTKTIEIRNEQWDKYREFIDETLTYEQIQELFYDAIRWEKNSGKSKQNLITELTKKEKKLEEATRQLDEANNEIIPKITNDHQAVIRHLIVSYNQEVQMLRNEIINITNIAIDETKHTNAKLEEINALKDYILILQNYARNKIENLEQQLGDNETKSNNNQKDVIHLQEVLVEKNNLLIQEQNNHSSTITYLNKTKQEVSDLFNRLRELEVVAEIYYNASEKEKAELRRQIISEQEYTMKLLATAERWNKEKFEILEKQRQSLIEIIREKNDELDKLREHYENRLTVIREEIVKLGSRINYLNKELNESEKTVEIRTNKIIELAEVIKDKDEQINNLTNQQGINQNLNEVINSQKDNIANLDNLGDYKNRKIVNLINELNILKGRLTYYQDQDSNLRDTILDLQNQVNNYNCSLPHLPTPHVCPIVQQVNCSHTDYDEIKQERDNYKSQLENHVCPDNSCSEADHETIRLEKEREIVEKLNTRLGLGLTETNTDEIIICLQELLNRPDNQEPKQENKQVIINNGENLEEIKQKDLYSLENVLSIPITAASEQQIKNSVQYTEIVKVREKLIKDELNNREKDYQLLTKKTNRLEKWQIGLIILLILKGIIITWLVAKIVKTNKKK